MVMKSYRVRIPGREQLVRAESILDASDAFYEWHGVWPTDVVEAVSDHHAHIRDQVFVPGCEYCDDETTLGITGSDHG